MEFTTFDLNHQVAAGVTAARYITPTPIQAKAIPLVMQGRDVIGSAQTGTGKTAAFALPILSLLDHHEQKSRCLVLEPTRELAAQVEMRIPALVPMVKLVQTVMLKAVVEVLAVLLV